MWELQPSCLIKLPLLYLSRTPNPFVSSRIFETKLREP